MKHFDSFLQYATVGAMYILIVKHLLGDEYPKNDRRRYIFYDH